MSKFSKGVIRLILWLERGSRWRVVVSTTTVVVTVLFMAFFIISYTPLKRLVPGYPDRSAEELMTRSAARLDSLESVVARWSFYTDNLQKIVEGADPVSIDEIVRDFQKEHSSSDPEFLRSRDSLLREITARADRFGLQAVARKVSIDGVHFFPPVKGAVTKSFEEGVHPFVEVGVPARNSVIMAVLDGTVIFARWSDENGYTVGIQHENDIVSFISGAAKLTVSSGDRVKAGGAVGMMGPVGDEAGTISVELWYKGEAVDPAAYIAF